MAMRGYHLVADGRGVSCPPGAIERFLRRAVDITGLTIIAGPFVEEDWGSGIVIIAESHISVHVRGARALVDCFSCAPFPSGKVVDAARDIFGGAWIAKCFERSQGESALRSGTSCGPGKGGDG